MGTGGGYLRHAKFRNTAENGQRSTKKIMVDSLIVERSQKREARLWKGEEDDGGENRKIRTVGRKKRPRMGWEERHQKRSARELIEEDCSKLP